MHIGNGLSLQLGKHQKQVNIRLKEMQDQHFEKRLWNEEEDLWIKGNMTSEIDPSLGWLNAPKKMYENLPIVEEFCESLHLSGFEHAVLLGMGGSSLAPFVFLKTLGHKIKPTAQKQIKLSVLDSTEPSAIRKIESEINLEKTLFIVSSKSGTTAEIQAFYSYFYKRVFDLKGKKAGENFIAITDANSPLAELASQKSFRQTFINFPNIGGRYSALSFFGILPAAIMGVDVRTLLQKAIIMMTSCGPQAPATQNPGVILGAVIAELALQGKDKLTYVLPPSLEPFGLWLEQLLAESTGKNSRGILPLNGAPLQDLADYGNDRLFFFMEQSGQKSDPINEELKYMELPEYAGIKIKIEDELDLGAEFFRWEIATATAGSILGVDPFNQPNVQESKKCTAQLLQTLNSLSKIPCVDPILIEDSMIYYGSQTYIRSNDIIIQYQHKKSKHLLEQFLNMTRSGDYISIQAYLPEEFYIQSSLSEMKQSLQKKFQVAVTSEFGPRYLHSTGQYHKGGPNTGLFIQLISSPSDDIFIPEYNYSFGMLKKAQAIGDMQALIQSNRRVLLIDLSEDLSFGLDKLKKLIMRTKRHTSQATTFKNNITVPSDFLYTAGPPVYSNVAKPTG